VEPTERLAAIEAISQLKARYFRTMDTKQWEEFRAVFTDDLELDVSADLERWGMDGSPGRVKGGDAAVAMIRSSIEHAVTAHHGHMPEIDVLDPDHATGIWAMADLVLFAEGSPLPGIRGYGHYHERYVRTPAGWKIAALRLTRLHVEVLS
jgi:hypothetical protein